MNKHLLNLLIIIGLILLSIPLILPFFNNGFFPTHDGEWAVVRAVEMFREVKDGQFPPRISGTLNSGYGYPLFNFAYPFPYYLSLVLHATGLSFLLSIKFLFALSVPLSAIFMYLAAKKLWQETLAGVLAAILYIYVPYRMVDLYVRGSLGESLSFVLFPLILYLLFIFLEEKKILAGILASISFAILVLTHNIMAVYFLLLLGLFLIASLIQGEKKYIKPFLLFGFLGLSLSCYFWLPALIEKQYILLSITPIAERTLHFPTLQQLFIPSWNYGVPPAKDAFSYQLGIPYTLLLIIFISMTIYAVVKKKLQSRILLFVLGVLALFFFLFSPLSNVVWKHLPLLNEINYPWTLLLPMTFLISLTSGVLVKEKLLRIILFGIVILAIFLTIPYASPSRFETRDDTYYISNDATTTSSKELMPLWVKEYPTNMPDKKVVSENPSDISREIFSSNKFSFLINSPKDQVVTINRIYYPGWEIKVNGSTTPISYENKKGVMMLKVPAGNVVVTGILYETPLRLISDIISILSLLCILIIYLKRKYIKNLLFH